MKEIIGLSVIAVMLIIILILVIGIRKLKHKRFIEFMKKGGEEK